MKYKKGSIVEVLTTDEVPYCSWRCAKIISGNGHNYTVTYDVYPGFTDEADVERVPRKSVRPCPPSVELLECWVPGDVVEVFYNLSWKMATVSEALGWNQFLVRLVGSFHEFEVSKSELRVRQSWQNGEWSVIGKVPRNYEDGRGCELLNFKYNQISGSQGKRSDAKGNPYMEDLCFAAQNNDNLQESRIVSSRTLKRGSPCYNSQGEANKGTAQKFRAAERDGRRLRVLVTSPEKVDAVDNTREMLCVKDMHASFDNRATHFSEANMERENTNGAYGRSHALSLEHNDADSITSSIGSCSINSYTPYEKHCKSGPVEDFEGHDSDAESVCQSGYREEFDLSTTNEELAAEIHRLELHAYRCTMEALHASGPLSWEKETMVTNLRMSLHISNDEHLIELKNLISATSSIHNR